MSMTSNDMNQVSIILRGRAMAADLHVIERHPDLETSNSGVIEARFAILIFGYAQPAFNVTDMGLL